MQVGPRVVVTKLTHAAFKKVPHVAPHAVDWDGDGDLDLLVGGDFGSVRLFVNQGTRKRPALAPAVELIPRKGGRHASPACRTREHCARRAKPWAVDWNGDGRLDLLVGDMHDHRTPKDNANERLTGWVWLYLRTAR